MSCGVGIASSGAAASAAPRLFLSFITLSPGVHKRPAELSVSRSWRIASQLTPAEIHKAMRGAHLRSPSDGSELSCPRCRRLVRVTSSKKNPTSFASAGVDDRGETLERYSFDVRLICRHMEKREACVEAVIGGCRVISGKISIRPPRKVSREEEEEDSAEKEPSPSSASTPEGDSSDSSSKMEEDSSASPMAPAPSKNKQQSQPQQQWAALATPSPIPAAVPQLQTLLFPGAAASESRSPASSHMAISVCVLQRSEAVPLMALQCLLLQLSNEARSTVDGFVNMNFTSITDTAVCIISAFKSIEGAAKSDALFARLSCESGLLPFIAILSNVLTVL